MKSKAVRKPLAAADDPLWDMNTTASVVAMRSGGYCEYLGCDQRGQQFHHRKPRGMGGSRNPSIHSPSNILHLCSAHHEWVESHRRVARDLGLLVTAAQDPERVFVELAAGRVRLTPGGTYTTREAS